MKRRSGVVLALFDVTEHGIDHVVLYGGAEGMVTDLLGSRDPGPFDTDYNTLQWALTRIQAWEPPPLG